MVPSSPYGPCSSGRTTSTSPSSRGTWPGSLHRQAPVGGVAGQHHRRAVGRHLGQLAAGDGQLLRLVGGQHPPALAARCRPARRRSGRGRSPPARCRPRRRRPRARCCGRRRRRRRGGGGAGPGWRRSRRSSRTTLPTAVRTGILAAMPPTPEPALRPCHRGRLRRAATAVAGRSEQPTAGDGLDLPRGRRGRLRPLRQPDLGDAGERGRRAGGRGRARRSRPGWPRSPLRSTWCRSAGWSWPRPTPTTAAWRCCAGWSSRAASRCARSTSPTPTAPPRRCEGAALVWAESPTNPMLRLVDIEALAARRDRGRRAAGRRQHLRHPGPAAPAGGRGRRRGAQRDEVPLRPLRPAARRRRGPRGRRSSTGWSRSAAPRARSRGRSRHGWPCAACAPCTCGWSGPRRTPRTSPTRLATHPTVSAVHYPGLGAMVSIELDRSPEDVEAIVRGHPALGARDESRRRRVQPRAAPPLGRGEHRRTGVPDQAVGRRRGRRGPVARPERGPVRARLSRSRQTGGHACCAAPHRRRHPRPPRAGPVLDPGARLVGAVRARAGDRDRPGRRRAGRHLLHAGDRAEDGEEPAAPGPHHQRGRPGRRDRPPAGAGRPARRRRADRRRVLDGPRGPEGNEFCVVRPKATLVG